MYNFAWHPAREACIVPKDRTKAERGVKKILTTFFKTYDTGDVSVFFIDARNGRMNEQIRPWASGDIPAFAHEHGVLIEVPVFVRFPEVYRCGIKTELIEPESIRKLLNGQELERPEKSSQALPQTEYFTAVTSTVVGDSVNAESVSVPDGDAHVWVEETPSPAPMSVHDALQIVLEARGRNGVMELAQSEYDAANTEERRLEDLTADLHLQLTRAQERLALARVRTLETRDALDACVPNQVTQARLQEAKALIAATLQSV